MTPTKDQQAQEYAEKKLKAFSEGTLQPYDDVADYFDFYDVTEAYTDGYTACEQSMWRSVDEELPSNDDKVFVIIRGAYVCGWYDQKYELWKILGMGSYNRKDASYWMPIPPFPTQTPRRNDKRGSDRQAIHCIWRVQRRDKAGSRGYRTHGRGYGKAQRGFR